VDFLLISENLERVLDHAGNIVQEVVLVSERGRGSRFTFTLPRADAAEAAR
jgi:phosphate uptake regulator